MLSSTFTSKDSLIAAVTSQNQQPGFHLSIKRSKARNIWLCCEKGSVYKDRLHLAGKSRVKQFRSLECDCAFEIVAKVRKSDVLWEIIKIHDVHNHDADSNLNGHWIARRITPEEKDVVRQLAESGIGPSQSMNVLRQVFANRFSTKREIYNELSLARRELLGDQMPIRKC